ncbi:hypothetical protein AAG570_008686 [Ranatra chinensis]|uniref:Uncharacterized protein n=1 Tax=Ranatra chinensis TaxID=642074 RepID=A0ABD0ZCS4_9HEMI
MRVGRLSHSIISNIINSYKKINHTNACALQILVVLASVAICLTAAGVIHDQHESHDDHGDYYSPPHYVYEYKVHDGHTGDVKSHQETREGDAVKGVYMQHQPDGTILEVHYTADKHNGYNAVVKKLGESVHPQHYHTEHHH